MSKPERGDAMTTVTDEAMHDPYPPKKPIDRDQMQRAAKVHNEYEDKLDALNGEYGQALAAVGATV